METKEAFETRFIELTRNEPTRVLPYVLDAIRTLGRGSAVAVAEKPGGLSGIQITLPVNMMHNMLSVLATYETKDLPEFLARTVYPGGVDLRTKEPGTKLEWLRSVIHELHIIPPDMNAAFSVGKTKVGEDCITIAVAGPASRKPAYDGVVKPALEQLSQIFK